MWDDPEDLDQLPAGSPLHDLMLAELEAQPLDVDAAAAARVAGAASGRMPRSRVWNGLIGLAAVATLAITAFAATNTDPLSLASDLFADPADREVALRAEAVDLHKLGKAEDDPAKLAEADAAYAAWFAEFAGAEKDPTMRYAWAELKYKRGEFAAAFDLYSDVASEHPDHPQARFCASSALFAADQLVQQDAPGARDRYAQAADRFVNRWGESDRKTARSAAYKAGYHYYAADDLAGAEPWLERTIALEPSSREATMALNLLLDLHVRAKDYEAVADRLILAFEQTPEAVDEDGIAIARQLAEHFANTAPARAAALQMHGYAEEDQ